MTAGSSRSHRPRGFGYSANVRLNIVNPNTSAAMTRTIAAAAEKAARPGTTIRAVELRVRAGVDRGLLR